MKVEAAVNGVEIRQSEGLLLVGAVLVSMPVEDALLELLEVNATRQLRESVSASPICYGRDEVGQSGDLVLATPHVVCDDAAEVLFGERGKRLDGELGADAEERVVMGGVGGLGALAQRYACVEGGCGIDSLSTNERLDNTDTEDSILT